jgi:ATP-dependent Clp protease adaptor protein ClpS
MAFKERVAEKTRQKLKEPPMYKVLLHNDDYTTMEFVVHILMLVFHKPVEEATQIMLNVHRKGIGVCGVYTKEIAETKVASVAALAKQHEFPLKCSYEEA